MSYDFQKFGYCWKCSALFERKDFDTPQLYYCGNCNPKVRYAHLPQIPVLYPIIRKDKKLKKRKLDL